MAILRCSATYLPYSGDNRDIHVPVPATYVIDESGVIILASVKVDYRERLDPEEALYVL